MNIKLFVFNTFRVNCYLCYRPAGEAVIIDPACCDEEERQMLVDFIRKNGLKLVRNINTHCHIDHVLGNGFIEKSFGIRPEYHPDGDHFFTSAKEIGLSFGYHVDDFPKPGGYLHDGDIIRFDGSELKVLETPGHAAGSISLYSGPDSLVFTGDVLFRDTVGRADLPSGDFDQLMQSIHGKLLSLPEETTVWPGHGPETTIGYEILNNPFIR